jgi:hypothetical protein
MLKNPRTSRSISLSTVSNLDHSQAGIYRTEIGKIDVIAVSDGTVGLELTKELIQNAKPGELERLLARHFEKSRWTLPSTPF